MSAAVTEAAARKDEHLTLAVRADAVHPGDAGLDGLRLRHRALPERDLDEVDLETELLGRRLRAPVLVSAMTGGTSAAGEVNLALARAASEHGVGLALGSGRVLLDEPRLASTFFDPDLAARPPLLAANLGAAQLHAPDSAARAMRVVELLGADALFIHLNPLQEAIQPEGQPFFAGVADALGELVRHLAPVPVAVKEVGFGLDAADVEALRDAGVAAIDVAGAGGTNWATIEGFRSAEAARTAAAFGDWGVPTSDAIVQARRRANGLPIVASGGLRHGVDAARCIALGATAAGFARPVLLAARAGEASEWLGAVVRQLRIAVWLAGEATPAALGPCHLESRA